MISLVVGVDRRTLTHWHANVRAADHDSAAVRARSIAAADGVDLVIAAVIGPNSAVMPEFPDLRLAA
jgi:hypothetical protein